MNTRGKPLSDFSLRHVVELVAKALADLVDGPPGDLLYVKRVGSRGCVVPLRSAGPTVMLRFETLSPTSSSSSSTYKRNQIAAFPRE